MSSSPLLVFVVSLGCWTKDAPHDTGAGVPHADSSTWTFSSSSRDGTNSNNNCNNNSALWTYNRKHYFMCSQALSRAERQDSSMSSSNSGCSFAKGKMLQHKLNSIINCLNSSFPIIFIKCHFTNDHDSDKLKTGLRHRDACVEKR